MKKQLLILAFILCVKAIKGQWSTNPAINNTICVMFNDQSNSKAISDGSGGSIIVWSDYRNNVDYDIYVQRINSAGVVQWSANGVAVCTATNDQLNPTITSDGLGGAIIAWQDKRVGGVFDIYSQRVSSNGAVQWVSNGVNICTATDTQDLPQIVSDGSNGAIITWQDMRNGINNDIYAQRVNSSGTSQWLLNGVAICTAPDTQDWPDIASNGLGGAIISWSDFRNGLDYNIYAQAINSAGVVQWLANGVPICTAADSQDWPDIVPNGTGGAIITWRDFRNGLDYDIYAQAINSAGAVQWSANGAGVCTANDSQEFPKIEPDGLNGAIITWQDMRGGANYDIYAQRINSSGVFQWLANGVAVCTAVDDQLDPVIISSGASGCIITWSDDRNGGNTNDIYAQRLDSTGAIQWLANGVAVSTATDYQGSPSIIPDSFGGAIITWPDYRNGNDIDIYVQNICMGGLVGGSTTLTQFSISGLAYVCSGNIYTYSVTPIIGVTSYSWSLPGGWIGTSTTNTISTTVNATSGSITVSVASACGTKTSAISVSVSPSPTLAITPTVITVCSGQSTTLTGNGASTYTWLPGSSTLTSISVNPTITATYTLMGKAANGCAGALKTSTVIVNACTGIETLVLKDSELTIHPNPNNGEFTISTTSQINITIVNALGKTILSKQIPEGNTSIDLSAYANGLYLIRTDYKIIRVIKN